MAMDPAICQLPETIQLMANVAPDPVMRQLTVLARLRELVSLIHLPYNYQSVSSSYYQDTYLWYRNAGIQHLENF